MNATYEDTGVCFGASLESLPKHITYWDCRLDFLHEKRDLKPSPNPTNGLVSIELFWNEAPKLEGSVIEVYKGSGDKIIEQNILISDEIKRIDLSPYQDGIYYVLWRKGNTIYAISEIQLIRN